MPFNFRLNLLSVFRSLGIQSGARLPQLNENVQMTMLVTDLSRLVPAPIEPRGLAGINLAGSPGTKVTTQLRSLAPGGIFIETLSFRLEGIAPTDDILIAVTNTDLGMLLRAQVNVGGSPIQSIFTADRLAGGFLGIPIPASSTGRTITFPIGVFVPNQAFFTASVRTDDQDLGIAILYRELPSVEEA